MRSVKILVMVLIVLGLYMRGTEGFLLPPKAKVTVEVVDEDGKPIEGARVTLCLKIV